MSKKAVKNVRKYLWHDDAEAGNARSRTGATNLSGGRAFSTRDYAVDQSVNLMAMGDQPVTIPGPSQQSSGGAFGLFRAKDAPKFDEFADAAASGDAEEYISDKQRRLTPFSASLQNVFNESVDSFAMFCGRLGSRSIMLCCTAIALVVIVGGFFYAIEEEPSRQNEIKSLIVDSGLTKRSVFDLSEWNPQKKALKWITHEDPAYLSTNDDSLLERYALAVFYFSTHRDSWKRSENWMTETGYCLWEGIKCFPRDQKPTEENGFEPSTERYDDNAPIISIDLSSNGIEGTIPREIAGLKSALTLDLQDNEMSGGLPDSLSGMTSLRALLLRKNSFVGSLPEDLFKLTWLHELHLGENQFEGGIDSQINEMKELRNLALNENLFTGHFPNLRNLTKLLHLFLDSNEFDGRIPSWIKNLKDIRTFPIISVGFDSLLCHVCTITNLFFPNPFSGELDISKNKFGGSIPEAISKLTDIEHIGLGDNQLTGTIPNMFDHIQRVSRLELQNNEFSGQIPNTVTHLQGLSKSISL